MDDAPLPFVGGGDVVRGGVTVPALAGGMADGDALAGDGTGVVDGDG